MSWTSSQLAHAKNVVQRLTDQGGAHSASDTLDLRKALTPIVGMTDACLLAAWVGGAPAAASLSWNDNRKPAEDVCDTSGFLGIGGRSVSDAAGALAAQDPALGAALALIGQAKAAKETASLNKGAKEDAEKIKKKAVATVAAATTIGGGISVVALAIAAGVFLWLNKRG